MADDDLALDPDRSHGRAPRKRWRFPDIYTMSGKTINLFTHHPVTTILLPLALLIASQSFDARQQADKNEAVSEATGREVLSEDSHWRIWGVFPNHKETFNRCVAVTLKAGSKRIITTIEANNGEKSTFNYAASNFGDASSQCVHYRYVAPTKESGEYYAYKKNNGEVVKIPYQQGFKL